MDPFIGQMTMASFNWAPRDWANCDGQLIPISQNGALYSLIGTNFGGDGRTTCGLPNLQGRVPMHYETSIVNIGTYGGEENVTITEATMATHSHTFNATTETATFNTPGQNNQGVFGVEEQPDDPYCTTANNLQALNVGTISSTGGSQSHDNMQPSLVVNFIMALQGLYPPRN